MTVSRCTNCNVYETAKTSNFKRHLERCKRAYKSVDASREVSTTRPKTQELQQSQKPETKPVQRSPEPVSVEPSAKKRAVQLTTFDIINGQHAASSDDGETDWNPTEYSSTELGRRPQNGHRLDEEPTLVSTPLMKQPGSKRHPSIPAPPPSKLRRPQEIPNSIMSLSERDLLVTRINELENMVMKLQHAVCVMDSRMQQFRMATSSWQSVTADD